LFSVIIFIWKVKKWTMIVFMGCYFDIEKKGTQISELFTFQMSKAGSMLQNTFNTFKHVVLINLNSVINIVANNWAPAWYSGYRSWLTSARLRVRSPLGAPKFVKSKNHPRSWLDMSNKTRANKIRKKRKKINIWYIDYSDDF
jgi:hypothetical protein